MVSYKNKEKAKSSDYFHLKNSNTTSEYRNGPRNPLNPHSVDATTSAVPTAQVVEKSNNLIGHSSGTSTSNTPRSSASTASRHNPQVRNCVTSDYSSAGSDCFPEGGDSESFMVAPADRLSFSDFTASSLFRTYRLRRKLAKCSAISLFPVSRLKKENNLNETDESERLVTAPQSPANLATAPQSPANLVTTPQSPANLVTAPQSPANLVTAPQSPANLVTAPQSPANLAVSPHSSESSSVKFGRGVAAVSMISHRTSTPNGSIYEYLSDNREWINEDCMRTIGAENTSHGEQEDVQQQEESKKIEAAGNVSSIDIYYIIDIIFVNYLLP